MPEYDSEEYTALRRTAYFIAYDEENLRPLFVYWILTKKMVLNNYPDRKNNFKPDPDIKYKITNKTYSKSGFDRGHLCPYEDMDDLKITRDEANYYTNILPQYPNFNRGVWLAFEKDTRKFVSRVGDCIIIVRPLYENPTKYLIAEKGKRLYVPTAFIKTIIYEENGEVKKFSFLFPHVKKTKTPKGKILKEKYSKFLK